MMLKRMTAGITRSPHRQSDACQMIAPKPRGITRSEKGETITEVLVAMLIAGLAILMLATVIATAFNILNSSRQSMEDYYNTGNQLAAASASADPDETGAIKIHELKNGVSGDAISLGGEAASAGIPVKVYEGGTDSSKPVVSYEINNAGGTP